MFSKFLPSFTSSRRLWWTKGKPKIQFKLIALFQLGGGYKKWRHLQPRCVLVSGDTLRGSLPPGILVPYVVPQVRTFLCLALSNPLWLLCFLLQTQMLLQIFMYCTSRPCSSCFCSPCFLTPAVPLPRRRKPASSPKLSPSGLSTETSPGLPEEGRTTDLVLSTDQGLVGLIEEGQTLDLVIDTDQEHVGLVGEGQSGALARVSTQARGGLSKEEVQGRGTADFDELNSTAVCLGFCTEINCC